jgi:hypothetical protein
VFEAAAVGTSLGPHVMRAVERPARLCTPCAATISLHTSGDLRKCVTTTYWGSSGRRFKSCQPDACQPDACQPDTVSPTQVRRGFGP